MFCSAVSDSRFDPARLTKLAELDSSDSGATQMLHRQHARVGLELTNAQKKEARRERWARIRMCRNLGRVLREWIYAQEREQERAELRRMNQRQRVEELQRRLREANGRRRARTLDEEDLFEVIRSAAEEKIGGCAYAVPSDRVRAKSYSWASTSTVIFAARVPRGVPNSSR